MISSNETLSSPIVIDSVTRLGPEAAGQVVIGGSHAGLYAAFIAARAGAVAAILNDAGIGLERAGIAGLDYLQRLGIPAAAVSHRSARIGDGRDCLARGRISALNALAAARGVELDRPCADAAERLAGTPAVPAVTPEERESRSDLSSAEGARLVVMDSVSLVRPEDHGAVIVTGSHGGLLGGRPETAVKVDVFAALYNDADHGIDDAGITRLPALDARGIAGATVSAWTARIGDGRSTYDTGVVTHVNTTGRRLGGAVGMHAKDLVALLLDAARKTETKR